MEILFNDTSFTREQRNMWLTMLFHRQIVHLDQLYKREASNVIEILKEMKESK